MIQLSHPYMTTGKTVSLTIWTFVSKVMSLFFNKMSRFVIVFPPRSKHLFELCCWSRLLRVPWTARRSDQSILKEISPGCSLKGMMLKLKLQYFGHLIWRPNSLEEDPDAGKQWRQLKRMNWLDSITNSVDISLSKLLEIIKDREAWHASVHGVTKNQTQLSNWATEQQEQVTQKMLPHRESQTGRVSGLLVACG